MLEDLSAFVFPIVLAIAVFRIPFFALAWFAKDDSPYNSRSYEELRRQLVLKRDLFIGVGVALSAPLALYVI